MEIYVFMDAIGITNSPLYIGQLSVRRVRGKEIFFFSADAAWAENKALKYLDADLKPVSGEQYVPEGKPNFGVFLDSCPDRWGRVLMQRRERIRAQEESRDIRKLHETDYLLGVCDDTRMGALRFKTDPNGPFLDNEPTLTTPPIASLRALEQASLEYERDDDNQAEYRKWIRMLYSPGSSLGGARPKANVVDTNGNLWIAKFPSRHDDCDVAAWEYLVTNMAREFGISVPETKLERFSSRYHTFLSKRFDRVGKQRIHFSSAMTLLGYVDGDDASNDVSYLEMADFLQNYGGKEQAADLKELWRRVLFNVAISNCDDHLRNHGFLLTPKGWKLSPAYDLTPNPQGMGLKLNIDEDNNALDPDLVLSTAEFYGYELKEATAERNKLKSILSNWRQKAMSIGLSRSEQDRFQLAFQNL